MKSIYIYSFLVFLFSVTDGWAQNQYVLYQYDSLNREKTATFQNGLRINYTYDALGNRLTKSRTILLPAAAGAITGTSAVCRGADSVAYSVPAITNAGWYIWSLPFGATIISGDSTRNILVNFSASALSGNITVYGKNEGGPGGVSTPFAITVSSIPGAAGAVSGTAQVTTGQSGVSYSVYPVAGATSYIWSLPAGASITSGAGTANITVAFSSGAISGTIAVKGINICGEGGSSAAFAVAVSAGVPATLTVQNMIVPSGQNPCYNATQTITVAGAGTTFTLQNGGAATLIAGQNIRFLPGTSVLSGGHLHAYIRPSGPWCNTAKSGEADYAEGEIAASADTAYYDNDNFRVKAWPNPVSDVMNVTWSECDPIEETVLEIRNLFGMKIFSTTVKGNNQVAISLKNLPPGLYLVRVAACGKNAVVKVVKK